MVSTAESIGRKLRRLELRRLDGTMDPEQADREMDAEWRRAHRDGLTFEVTDYLFNKARELMQKS